MGNLLIIGGGGHGRVLADAAAASRRFDRIQFVEKSMEGRADIDGFPCTTGDPEPSLFPPDVWLFVVGIGDNGIREAAQTRLAARGYGAATLVHPAAYVSARATLGPGTVVLAGAVVQTGAILGEGVIVNNQANVDHDTVMERFSHIGPGAILAGDVHVGDHTFIGAGTSVSHGVRIVAGVTTGVGAAVAADILEPGIYAGVPVRRLSRAMERAKPER